MSSANKKAKNGGEEFKSDVFLPLRIFKDGKNKTVGFGGWNCFYRKDVLATMGLPAGSYIHFDNLKKEREVCTDEDVWKYVNTNDPDASQYTSLAHLFYFSNEELREWGLQKQMQGFYFVSCKGLQDCDEDKWNTGGKQSLKKLTAAQLSQEVDGSCKKVQAYLQEECVQSHRAGAKHKHMEKAARYTLIKQVRVVPDGAMGLFERVLNIGTYITRKPDFNGDVKPVQSVAEIV